MQTLHQLLYEPNGESLSSRLRVDFRSGFQLRRAAALLSRELRAALSLMAGPLRLDSHFCIPKFRPQGSIVYGTTISPALPSQRLDLDLGLYLPERFVVRLGGSERLTGDRTREYFDLIDGLLSYICRDLGFVYPMNEQKRHCCRVFLNPQRSLHVDIPIYVVADSESTGASPTVQSRPGSRSLGVRSPLLAGRDGEWKASDVRISTERFAAALSCFYEPGVMLRQWRYLKAWRDFKWQEGGGPPSIVLMEAGTRALTSTGVATPADSDDVMLQRVFRHLTNSLASPLLVQWGGAVEDLSRDADSAQRCEWALEAGLAADRLEQARYSSSWEMAKELLVDVFGSRVNSQLVCPASELEQPDGSDLSALRATRTGQQLEEAVC